MVSAFQSCLGGATAVELMLRGLQSNTKTYWFQLTAQSGGTSSSAIFVGNKSSINAEICGTGNPLDTSSGDTTNAPDNWTDGDTLITGGRIIFTSFSVLNANQVMGFFWSRSTSATQMDSTNTLERIGFAINSSGQILLISSDGTNVTSSNSGFTATTGVPVQFELKFIKGTSLSLDINGSGSPFSISSNLPLKINAAIAGFGSSSTTAPKLSFNPFVMHYEGSS